MNIRFAKKVIMFEETFEFKNAIIFLLWKAKLEVYCFITKST